MRHISFAFALLVLPAGCSSDNGSSGSTAAVVSAVTDDNGVAAAVLPLPPDANKAAVVAATDGSIGTISVVNDLGVTYVSENGELTSLAPEPDNFESTAIVPSRDVDPPLGGSSLTVTNRVFSLDEADFGSLAAGHQVDYTLITRRDADLSSGSLRVNVIFVGPTAADPLLHAAMKRAYRVFEGIYAKAGITLQIAESSASGPYILPDPFEGDPLYEQISSSVRSPAVNICIGEDVSSGGLLGEAGGIPGSPVPSKRSCVDVSVINGSGPEGDFNEEFTRVLGETLAHESGHYLGLFHPVEGDYETFDPLGDTPDCVDPVDCDAQLGTNFMYYTPILDESGTALVPQGDLTSQQAAVMNRYIAVD